MIGQLFTQYFLTEGIQATDAWQDCVRQPRSFTAFKQSLSEILDKIASAHEPNEAQTENEVVRPLLELLGWDHQMPQQGSDRQEDIPDYLLFADEEAKDRAAARKGSENRYQDALVIEESKRFGLPLDNRDSGETSRRGTPHGQILRYLDTADSVTDGRIRWGILTNGAVWRLYDFRARPRASGFYEADLKALLQQDDDHALHAIFLLFRRESFIAQEGAATTFLEDAIAEGKRYEQRVAADLSEVVFSRVFPGLVEALADRYAVAGDPSGDLTAVRHAALIFLYRLLFILYAEDRGLLPVNDSRYDDYGLRKRVRDDVAMRMQSGDTFSSAATNYYDRLNTLFRLIDRGDPSIGLPPYNGGLFSRDSAPLLKSVCLPDSVIADIIYDLSHTRSARKGDSVRSFVNYRDMSVQQLGSIYERLLEQEPVRGDDGKIGMRPNPYARKDSGSFYTPQELVDLIVDKTLAPLVEERLTAFKIRAKELKSDHRPKLERRKELEALDPAVAALDLKILDPAMGSGHFLVTAVDYLSDDIAHMVEKVPAMPEWLDDGCGSAYVSPLVERIAVIREEILQRACESDWAIDASLLTDQAIIRRMVLKRCIYGVDKNPLAVELAKVSLWLHSFTVGAPLSFLDHHLRCGDSLLGLRVTEAVDELIRVGGLFLQSAVAGAETAAEGMEHIELLSDADVAEVRESATLFREVESTTADLRSVLDVLCGLRWLTAGMKKKERTLFEAPLFETLGRQPNDAFKLLAHGPDVLDSHQADAIRHSGESRNPGTQSGASDINRPSRAGEPIRPSRESDDIRHARAEGDRHSGAHGDRHSGECRNPSSPRPLDSGFHRSDEPDDLPDRHSRESDVVRHSGESRNPSSPHPLDSGFHRSDDTLASNLRHSGESRNPSSPAASPPGSAGLQPASGSAGPQPASGSAGLQPASGSAGLQPASGSADLQPASGSVGLQPASGQGDNPPTPDNALSGATEFATLWHNARTIADRETFLHWEAAFPGVWKQWQDSHPRGGFDAVIGNPPWDRIKLQEVEWFATRAPELARAPTAAARRAAIQELRAQGDPLAADFDDAKGRADSLGRLVRASGHYPLLGGGDINLYSLFVERAMRLVKADGLVGLLTPSGIYADLTAAKFFKSVSTRGRVAGLYDFENRRLGTDLPPFFPDVDSRFKFCALIFGGAQRQFDATACAFFLHDTKAITDEDRCFPLAPDDFARVNPNTGTAPVFRTRRDADITRDIYARHPVLVDRSDGTEHKTWPVKYHTMFHMTNDSHLFRTAAQLDAEGFYPVKGNRWQRGKELYLPLYQGRMIWHFDHRANSVQVNPNSTHNPYLSKEVVEEQHANPEFLPQSQYWVPSRDVDDALPKGLVYALGFRDITNPTNERTMVASLVPRVGFGNTLPILFLNEAKHSLGNRSGDDGSSFGTLDLACLTANLDSLCLDFIARQKAQGTHMNWYIVEQLPVIAPEDYDRQFGEKTARDLVRDHVLRLTYTAHDMAPFARDLGYVGPPFIWDEEERRHLRARLDALYFHLYGVTRADADYILSTFPIVRRQDEAAFNRYRTRDLIRAYMSALQAGDTETVVELL